MSTVPGASMSVPSNSLETIMSMRNFSYHLLSLRSNRKKYVTMVMDNIHLLVFVLVVTFYIINFLLYLVSFILHFID